MLKELSLQVSMKKGGHHFTTQHVMARMELWITLPITVINYIGVNLVFLKQNRNGVL